MSKIKKQYFLHSVFSLFRLFCGYLCILLVLCLSACGHTVSKSSLLSYAKETYGECSLISEEHSGSGTDEIRTLYLQDADTGLEYSVTSKMVSQGLDGSEFVHFEQKSSDFDEKYKNYVYDHAEQEMSELTLGHPGQVMLSDSYLSNKIIFDSRTSDDDSKIVCRKVSEIIARNDVKNYLPINFLVYCENEAICIGSYDYTNDTFESYEPYKVIDYVYENIDKDAEFLSSTYGTPDMYLSNENLETIGSDEIKYSTYGTFYLFRSSTGVEFFAVDMEEFGMRGIYCVTKDSREEFKLSVS